MGAISFSINVELVNHFQRVIAASTFVETGTFEGDSIEIIRTLFDEIHSIELSKTYYEKAKERFKNEPKVKLYQGSSDQWLRSLQPQLKDKSVYYWLDAHWCVASSTAGESSQSPLLHELDAIQILNDQSLIMIDDARLYLCTPPRPHESSQWPSFDRILKKLISLSSTHEIAVINDVIVYYPNSISHLVSVYAQEKAIDWLSVLDKSRHYDTLLVQLKEKDAEISLLSKSAYDRLLVIEQKEAEIQSLAFEVKQSFIQIEQKEAEIQSLAFEADERLQIINNRANLS